MKMTVECVFPDKEENLDKNQLVLLYCRERYCKQQQSQHLYYVKNTTIPNTMAYHFFLWYAMMHKHKSYKIIRKSICSVDYLSWIQ